MMKLCDLMDVSKLLFLQNLQNLCENDLHQLVLGSALKTTFTSNDFVQRKIIRTFY